MGAAEWALYSDIHRCVSRQLDVVCPASGVEKSVASTVVRIIWRMCAAGRSSRDMEAARGWLERDCGRRSARRNWGRVKVVMTERMGRRMARIVRAGGIGSERAVVVTCW
jgi:hypothetical protein